MVRILFVDDMETLKIMIERDLTRQGYAVFTASSGAEALEIFRYEPIDAVVCDLHMDEMSGLEVSKAVKDLCKGKGVPKTPFILLTGYGSELSEDDNLELLGVDRVVDKPVDLKVLRNCLAEITGQSQDQSNL